LVCCATVATSNDITTVVASVGKLRAANLQQADAIEHLTDDLAALRARQSSAPPEAERA
jgi:hypothetical protein